MASLKSTKMAPGSLSNQNRSLSVSSNGDNESDSSSPNEDCNTTLGSMSLRDELQSVSRVLSNLKNACPQRSNPAREKKNISGPNKTKNDFIPKIIDYLDIIHNLNVRIIDKIDELSLENLKLHSEIQLSNKQSYASVATRMITSNSEGEVGATTSSPTSAEPSQPNIDDNAAIPELHKISSRVDQLEQNSLSNVFILQGAALDASILQFSRNEEATSDTKKEQSEERRIEERQPASLKRAVCNLLKPMVPNISDNSFTSASIQGKERKSVIVVCSSTDEKIRLVTKLKSTKPTNLYANDYLTKLRATLLYKARSLKRRFPSIIGAYSRNGQIYCKLTVNEKPLALNNLVELNKLEERLINSHTG